MRKPSESSKLSFYLTQDTARKLRIACAEKLASMSSVVEEAIVEYLKKKKR
jgi:hypothetical protein